MKGNRKMTYYPIENEEIYLYDWHVDGLYLSLYEKEYEDLYCEICGESDTYIGCFTLKELANELWRLGLDEDFIKVICEVKKQNGERVAIKIKKGAAIWNQIKNILINFGKKQKMNYQ